MDCVVGVTYTAGLFERQAGGVFPMGLPVFKRIPVSGVGAVF